MQINHVTPIQYTLCVKKWTPVINMTQLHPLTNRLGYASQHVLSQSPSTETEL